MKPTIFVTNNSSRKPPYSGTKRRFNIMAMPRDFEAGDGNVSVLTPLKEWVRAVKDGEIPFHYYRMLYESNLLHDYIGPGKLIHGRGDSLVQDGDTLFCSCSRAAAAEGRCHRAWAAKALHEAGWRVVLDGEVLDG